MPPQMQVTPALRGVRVARSNALGILPGTSCVLPIGNEDDPELEYSEPPTRNRLERLDALYVPTFCIPFLKGAISDGRETASRPGESLSGEP